MTALLRNALGTGRLTTPCIWAVAAAAVLSACPAAAQPVDTRSLGQLDLHQVTATLEREIRRAMMAGQIPSLTIALVADGDMIWSAGFGDSNLRAQTPATPSTVYMVASIFKTVVATAVLTLVEDGHIDLDDPVREYLTDFSIRRESRRDPVTFRHLLTHTSGLPTVFSPTAVWAENSPPPIAAYLKENLMVMGPPLERVRYSNMGFTLLAHLVEEISGKPFDEYVETHVLRPLGMTSTAFAPTPEMEERLSVPYVPDPDSGRPMPVARVRSAEWPAAGAWGTVEDQARWLAMNLNGGSYQGQRILSPELLALAHTQQYPDLNGTMAGGWGNGVAGYGLAWWTTERNGERYIAHSGSVQGYTSFVHGNLDRGVGVAILTNANRAHHSLVNLAFLATDLLAPASEPVPERRAP